MRLRDQLCIALGGVALLTSVLVVGGAPRWTQAIVAGSVGLALAVQLFARRQLDRRSPLVVLLGLASVLTAIQLIPLPVGLLDTLNPTGTQLRLDGATIAKTSPWMSLSLDPAATLRSLTFFITLLGVALISLRFAAAERGRFALLAAVAIACGLAAAVAGSHMLVSARSLYGIYESQTGAPVTIGPLLNPNHLGGLMAIGAVLSLGLAFYNRQPIQLRVLWIVTGIGCVGITAASLSRGAMVGLVIGLLITGTILITGRYTATEGRPVRRGKLRNDLPIAIVIGLGLAIALYMSAGGVVAQLGDTSVTELNQPGSKYAAWKSSLALVKESPWTGIGRGAVEVSLTRVYPGSAHFTYSQLENEYLSAVVEWGIPGAILLAAAFAWCFRTAMRRWRDGPLAAAALGALAVILFQSSVDFGIELLGLAVPVTIIAASVQLVPLRPAESSPLLLRVRRAALVVLLAGAAAMLLLPLTRTLQEDHDGISFAEHPTMEDVRASVERHPFDYVGFGQAASMASRAGDPGAVDYLNHALRLHPNHPGLHRLAARMLVASRRYQQASVEYALAMSAEPAPRRLLEEIVRMLPDSDDAAAAIPTDYPNLDPMLHSLREINRQDIAAKWLMRVAQRPQHDLRVIDTLYAITIAQKDFVTANAAAELRLKVANTTTSRLMLAKVQFLRQDFAPLMKGLDDVMGWNGRIDEKAEAWLILCDVHIERRDWDAALLCIHRLDGSGLATTLGRIKLTKRIHAINEQRTYESKMEAIKAMEKSLGMPLGKPTTPPPSPPMTAPTAPTTPR